jgi:hypothetical protein
MTRHALLNFHLAAPLLYQTGNLPVSYFTLL